MLRTRDFFAAAGLLWLTKSTYFNNNAAANSKNLSASLRLAFYIPRSTTSSNNLFPEVFDVDGDGTPEALAVIVNATPTFQTQKQQEDQNHQASTSTTSSWNVQILDLRQFKSTTGYQHPYPATVPFHPKKLIDTDRENAVTGSTVIIENENDPPYNIPLIPLAMTTGQVLKSNDSLQEQKQGKQTKNKSPKNDDKTVQYFCGTDWHDAASKCATHCPSGQSSDCPENERCFADTGCYANQQQQQKQQLPTVDYEKLHTTPAGGWPSIFTVFSQGIVAMHSLTAEQKDVQQPAAASPQLQLKRMWQVNPLLKNSNDGSQSANAIIAAMEWEDVAVTFVDAVSSSSNNGLLVVAGTTTAYYHRPLKKQNQEGQQDDDDEEEEDERFAEFVVALDALTGRTIWQSLSEDLYQDNVNDQNEQLPLPFQPSRGTTSAARRRSLIPQHVTNTNPAVSNKATTLGVSGANCMREYRRSLLTSSGAMPFQYWGAADDTVVMALHFDHQGGAAKTKNNGNSNGKPATAPSRRTQSLSRRNRWWPGKHRHKRHHRHHDSPLLGRPNVIVTHNYQGIQVRALKNGQSLCHLSLEDHTLYHDMNHDGTLDSLQIITSSNTVVESGDDDEVVGERDWVQKLARRVMDLNKKEAEKLYKNNDAMMQRLSAKSPLCHLLALSGLPTKEELFSVNLCGKYNHEHQQQLLQHDEIVGAPLLIMEPSSRDARTGHDVVAAVSTGTVSRFRGSTGRRMFQENGQRHYPDFPVWDHPTNVLLSRIDSRNVVPYARPIVLAGENSVVLLSSTTGKILASATFPQLSSRNLRPRLVDLNGDGTTDLLVSTTDAVWGYQIVVRTGATVFYRIATGLLILAMMLAVLRNKFGPNPGKRSTDL